jgi:hypothetical protein
MVCRTSRDGRSLAEELVKLKVAELMVAGRTPSALAGDLHISMVFSACLY